MPSRIPPRRQSAGALSGVLYVLFFLAGIAISSITAPSGPFATPYSGDATVRHYLAADPSALHRSLQLSALLQALSALALLAFVPWLSGFVMRCGAVARAGLVRAMGTTSAALLVLSASGSWVLSMLVSSPDLPVARALMDLTFITGAAPAVGTLGVALWGVSRTALESRALPAWVGWSGLLLGAVGFLSLLSLVAEPATVLIPIGRYVGFAWFAAVSVMLWRREARTGHPGAADGAGGVLQEAEFARPSAAKS